MRAFVTTLSAVAVLLASAAYGDEIHEAAAANDLEALRSILDDSPGSIDMPDSAGLTPLYIAATVGHTDVVRELLARNADFTIGDADSSLPIHLAAAGGHIDVMDQLLGHGGNIDAVDRNGTTPLIFALTRQQPAAALWLIDLGADVKRANGQGVTPLHYAAFRQEYEIVERLIELGADVSAQTQRGNAPLHYAARAGDLRLARMLVEHGAQLEQRDDYGRTPLLLTARESGNAELARILVDRGADINAEDRAGDTPLILAAWRGFESMVDFFLERGVELPSGDAQRREIVGYAAANGLTRLFTALVDDGVSTDFPSVTGGTLLHDAAAGGSDGIVSVLLQEGHDSNGLDRYGRTPLHYAAQGGRIEATRALIARGVDMNARSLSGCTPFNVALEYGRDNVAALLREYDADTTPVRFPRLTGLYLGQAPPGTTPQMFALDIVSSNEFEHGCVTFSPEGDEAYWTRSVRLADSGYTQGFIMTSRIENGRWSRPEIAAFSAIGQRDDIPVIAPDGERLYFISGRDPSGIWYLEREGNGWSEPRNIEGGPNEQSPYWQFSVAANRNIYFASEGDVWISRYADGVYESAERLNSTITTPFGEEHPCIAPDEGFLIFGTDRYPDSLGGKGFRITFRDDAGRWTTPLKLECEGKVLSGICPVLSPDGKYLFYNNMDAGSTDIYWVDVEELLDSLREAALSQEP